MWTLFDTSYPRTGGPSYGAWWHDTETFARDSFSASRRISLAHVQIWLVRVKKALDGGTRLLVTCREKGPTARIPPPLPVEDARRLGLTDRQTPKLPCPLKARLDPCMRLEGRAFRDAAYLHRASIKAFPGQSPSGISKRLLLPGNADSCREHEGLPRTLHQVFQVQQNILCSGSGISGLPPTSTPSERCIVKSSAQSEHWRRRFGLGRQ